MAPFSSTRAGWLGAGLGFGFGLGFGLLLPLSLPGTGEFCVVVVADDDGVDGVDISAHADTSTAIATKHESLLRIA